MLVIKGALRYNPTDLGYAEAGDGEPSDQVTLELAEGVVSAPVEHRKDVLKGEPDLLGLGLVFVLPQWVVGEERLLHRIRELGEEVLLRWEADLIPMPVLHAAVRGCPASNVGTMVVFSPI